MGPTAASAAISEESKMAQLQLLEIQPVIDAGEAAQNIGVNHGSTVQYQRKQGHYYRNRIGPLLGEKQSAVDSGYWVVDSGYSYYPLTTADYLLAAAS
jgi:hypothetical protein